MADNDAHFLRLLSDEDDNKKDKPFGKDNSKPNPNTQQLNLDCDANTSRSMIHNGETALQDPSEPIVSENHSDMSNNIEVTNCHAGSLEDSKPTAFSSVIMRNSDAVTSDVEAERDLNKAKKKIVAVGLVLVGIAIGLSMLIGIGIGYALGSAIHNTNDGDTRPCEMTTILPYSSTTMQGEGTNMVSLSGAECSSSTTFSPLYTCDKAIDTDANTRWTTAVKSNSGQYIEISFPTMYVIEAVSIQPHCFRSTQCDKMEVGFSNGDSFFINETCTGKDDWSCRPIPLRYYPVPAEMSVNQTGSLRLTCLHQCYPAGHHWTIYEINIWGDTYMQA